MKDFAKSIHVGNASGIKEFNTEADLRRWCIEHQYTYTPTHGGYYRLEDDKPGRNRPDLAAHVKAGNKKVLNTTIKFYGETIDLTKESESYLKEILEELQALHEQSDAQRAIKEELAKRKRTGNSKVGNLSHTKEEAKTKDEYFKILKFYQTQGYKTNAGEYNPNGRIKLHKGDDSVEIVLVGNSKVGNGLSDSYEFLMSAGKNDYNSIKEEVKKAGGWTPEIKAKARKTSDTLKKKAKELVETAHKQSAELERLAGDIESI